MDPKTPNTPPSSEVLKVAVDLWGQSAGQHYLPVTGTSMLPFIQAGDYVLVSHGERRIGCGDIVVFRKEGELIAHRVIGIDPSAQTGPAVYTRGDNSSLPDPLLNPGDILGRVVALKRGDRLWSIDNPVWRFVNRQIAWALRAARPLESGGAGSSPPSPTLRRDRPFKQAFFHLFSAGLKVLLVLFGWWKN